MPGGCRGASPLPSCATGDFWGAEMLIFTYFLAKYTYGCPHHIIISSSVDQTAHQQLLRITFSSADEITDSSLGGDATCWCTACDLKPGAPVEFQSKLTWTRISASKAKAAGKEKELMHEPRSGTVVEFLDEFEREPMAKFSFHKFTIIRQKAMAAAAPSPPSHRAAPSACPSSASSRARRAATSASRAASAACSAAEAWRLAACCRACPRRMRSNAVASGVASSQRCQRSHRAARKAACEQTSRRG